MSVLCALQERRHLHGIAGESKLKKGLQGSSESEGEAGGGVGEWRARLPQRAS
jgi:hypothetical protein